MVLAFLHTAQLHVETFGLLARQVDDSVFVRHEVRPDLLAMAMTAGVPPEQVQTAVSVVLRELSRDGARVILCTCSTLGGLAEATVVPGCTVLRVDRPVAEQAVSSGRRILVVAALPTALLQTRSLLREVADDGHRAPEIVDILCERAWLFFERGDTAAYLAAVADSINCAASSGDLILLAQASMAPVAQLLRRSDVHVLSSPRLGVEAAFAAYRRDQ
ncbi:MAG TPA: hypothetical protein VER96_07025 [Polyangiaceae bacterium]|nr:hypothetical protein [Polyangiaceae bacterium]